jgi:OPA family glycerol-3-phosphate transporter-like MFS transporter
MKSSVAWETVMVPDNAAASPFRRWQGVTLALLITGYAGYYLCRSNLSVCLPMIAGSMTRGGMDPATARIRLGSIASLGVLAYAIGKFPSGALADFLGGKRNFLLGMAGAVLFTLWFASGGSLSIFTMAWVGNRLVQSLGWAGVVKITSRWFSYRNYGTVMALVSLSFLFGDALARRFLAVLIAGHLSWREIFVVAAAVLAAILVVCLPLLRESPRQIGLTEPPSNPQNLFGKEGERPAPEKLRSLLRPMMRSPIFWMVCGLSVGTTLVREAFGLWTPTYFTQAAGFTAAEAAEKSALFPLLGGISVLLCGWLSDRVGARGRAALIFIGLALSGAVLLWLALGTVSRASTVILVSAVAFLIIGPYSFLAGAISLDFGGKQGASTASGLIDGTGYLGAVLAGDTMARVSVTFGWNGFFVVLAGVAFLTSVAAGVYWARLDRSCMIR